MQATGRGGTWIVAAARLGAKFAPVSRASIANTAPRRDTDPTRAERRKLCGLPLTRSVSSQQTRDRFAIAPGAAVRRSRLGSVTHTVGITPGMCLLTPIDDHEIDDLMGSCDRLDRNDAHSCRGRASPDGRGHLRRVVGVVGFELLCADAGRVDQLTRSQRSQRQLDRLTRTRRERGQGALQGRVRGARERSRVDVDQLRGCAEHVGELNAGGGFHAVVDDLDRLGQGAAERHTLRALVSLEREVGHRRARAGGWRRWRRDRVAVVGGLGVKLSRGDGGLGQRAGRRIARRLDDDDVDLDGPAAVQVRDDAGDLGRAQRARSLVGGGGLDRRAGRHHLVQHDVGCVPGPVVLDRDVVIDSVVAKRGRRHGLALRDREVGRLRAHRPRDRADVRLRGHRAELLAERRRDERRQRDIADLVLGGDVVVNAHLEADLGSVAGGPSDRQVAASAGGGAAAEEEANSMLRGVVLAQVVAREIARGGHVRGRTHNSQRARQVGGVRRQRVHGNEVPCCLEPLIGVGDRVAQLVSRLRRTVRVGQVRDCLGRVNHRRVEIGRKRDHMGQVLIAAGLERDFRAGRAIGEDPVDPEHLRVEPELVDVVGRLVGGVLAIDRDRAVEEVVGRGDFVAERLSVQRRLVPRQSAVALVGDEPEFRADRPGERRLEAAHRNLQRRLGLRDRLQPIEHREIARRVAGGLIGDHQSPTGIAVLPGGRLHVGDRVHPGSSTPHLARDINEHAVGALHLRTLVQFAARAAQIRSRPEASDRPSATTTTRHRARPSRGSPRSCAPRNTDPRKAPERHRASAAEPTRNQASCDRHPPAPSRTRCC